MIGGATIRLMERIMKTRGGELLQDLRRNIKTYCQARFEWLQNAGVTNLRFDGAAIDRFFPCFRLGYHLGRPALLRLQADSNRLKPGEI
jgi:hypothetical protein